MSYTCTATAAATYSAWNCQHQYEYESYSTADAASLMVTTSLLLLLPPAPLLLGWRATCKAAKLQSVVHASSRPQTAAPAADDASWGTTVERRKASFTYSPPAGVPAQRTSKSSLTQPQQRRSSGSSKPLRHQQQRQHQHQAVVQPDPAADDLDALVSQAATVTPTGSGSNGNSSSSSTSSFAAVAALPTTIYSVPAADQPTRAAAAAAAAMQAADGRQPRYTAADKLHLTPEAAKDIASRLRKAGPPKRGQPVFRVFRYGIDDLRLYKALDLAGLEGRVVVVDTMQFADAVLTTRSKRTGKAVNLAEARRAAQGAGVPLFVLRAVSAQRVLEALAPLLGLEQQPQQLLSAAGAPADQPQRLGAELPGSSSSSSSSFGREPRLLRWDEVEGDSSEELLQLLWCPAGHASSNSGSGSIETAAVVEVSPRWLAWHASQQQQQQCQLADDGSSAALHPAAGVLAGAPAAVLESVRNADVEDAREALLPANPKQRAGERYMLRRPLRHGSRLRKRRLQRDLWQQQVPW
ncbi:hypothetical protein COO60DRAFT_612472 [Scenedesmus sp. NREL 46B-D3]|nr:hypothetical protein COO60DRAFT_612472 [Scenedesmus sp. NREL 46B-D3]